MGYHSKDFKKVKGQIGEFSKIAEEFQELEDANKQGCKVLEICELTDLIGAIEIYANLKYELSIDDLVEFAHKTQEAFVDGER